VSALVGAALCGACGRSTAPATIPIPPPKPITVSAAELAMLGVVQPNDLPAGWREVGKVRMRNARSVAVAMCGADPLARTHAAAFERDYGLQVAIHRGDDARVYSAGITLPDTTTATRQYAGVDRPEYTKCRLASINALIQAVFHTNVVIRSVGARAEMDLGVPTTFEKFASFGPLPSCTCVVFTTLVLARVRRVVVGTIVISPDAPINDGTVNSIVSPLVTRLQRAQA
jgi:hypothetical protein